MASPCRVSLATITLSLIIVDAQRPYMFSITAGRPLSEPFVASLTFALKKRKNRFHAHDCVTVQILLKVIWCIDWKIPRCLYILLREGTIAQKRSKSMVAKSTIEWCGGNASSVDGSVGQAILASRKPAGALGTGYKSG